MVDLEFGMGEGKRRERGVCIYRVTVNTISDDKHLSAN